MADPHSTVVLGKDDPNVDVPAVQQAFDRGGSISLHGVFDFGGAGCARITRDVSIRGEPEESGRLKTKVKGGHWTFQSSLPEDLPVSRPGPEVSIEKIHFEGASWCPIYLPYCSGARIVANRITGTRRVRGTVFGKEGMYRHAGIAFMPLYALPEEQRRYQPGLIVGKIVVADNHIDLTNQVPEETMAQGVLVLGTTGADIQILRNRVLHCSRNSIECLDNYPSQDGRGSATIHGNVILTSESGIPLPTPRTPNGIIAGWFLDSTGATDPLRTSSIVVTGNQVTAMGRRSLGIAVLSRGAVIADNEIVLREGARSKAVFAPNCEVRDNQVRTVATR